MKNKLLKTRVNNNLSANQNLFSSSHPPHFFLPILSAIFYLFLVASSVICLIISEHFFFDKLFYRKSAIFGYDLHESDVLHHPLPEIMEKRVADLKNLVEVNGLKIKGVSTEKPYYNVALIGDSMFYGTGVKLNQRVDTYLESELNTYRPTKVYNYSQPGDSIFDNYTKLLLAKNTNPADVYVIGIVSNDLIYDFKEKYPNLESILSHLSAECSSRSEIRYDNITCESEDNFESCIYDKFYYRAFSRNSQNWCVFEKILSELENKPVIFLVASAYEDTGPYTDYSENNIDHNVALTRYVSTVKNKGFQVINPFLLTSEYGTVSILEGHPNSQTHKLFADSITYELVSNSNLKFLNGEN